MTPRKAASPKEDDMHDNNDHVVAISSGRALRRHAATATSKTDLIFVEVPCSQVDQVRPPSASIVRPVIQRASSEARKAMTSAISSGSASRFNGVSAA